MNRTGPESVPAPRRPARGRRATRTAAAVMVALMGGLLAPGPAALADSPVPCAPQTSGGPMWVTADCVDPDYGKPVIDNQQDVTGPVPVHKVAGHFDGTQKMFDIYLPPKAEWQGRFFQYVYPTIDQNITDENLEFDVASGGYAVQTNSGGGYRVDAAAAKFAKTVAARYYGATGRIYGYVWGGSGGSYQTVGATENSTGVWDGFVPFIVGVPTSIPNNFFIRALGALVLKDKGPQIADAAAPGGGDPYAGLNDLQKGVLTELTKMGVPLRALEDYRYVFGLGGNATAAGPSGLLGFASFVKQLDPTYAADFWSKPGYLGTDESPLGGFLRAGKVDQAGTITEVNKDAQGNPASVVLDRAVSNPYGTGLDLTVYGTDGTGKGTLTGTADGKSFTLDAGGSAAALAALVTGGNVHVDNLWYLALPVYSRYDLPTRPGFYSFDQYRGPGGAPLYPQRPVQTDVQISQGASPGNYTGKINGKVITVCNLLDSDAFTWDGDWYTRQVRQALGAGYNDNYRIWFNDNADHIAPGRTARLIDYTGILQQALRDVAAWAEKGIRPPESTNYQERDSQISVPANAAERRGIQPVVDLDAGGKDRIEVAAGQPVTFHGRIQVPPGTGKVVATAWNFTGTGGFTPAPVGGAPRETADVTGTFTYDKPGTYFAELRATAQREGDDSSSFAQVQNLGRIRVVVR